MSKWKETEIGRYPNDWEVKKLSEITRKKVTYGIVQPGFHNDNGIPILRVNNIKGGVIEDTDVMKVSSDVASKYTRTQLNGDEILITLVGNLGEVAIVPKKYAGWNIARAVGKIELNDKSDNNWVVSWLTSAQIKHFIKTHANTTVQHTLNLSDVENLPIVLPPKKQRDDLAYFITTLNKKITLLRKQNQDLEELAQILFKRWFVEFEFPISLEHDSEECLNHDSLDLHDSPDHHDLKNQGNQSNPKNQGSDTYKSSGGKMVESELGEIPEGWRVGYFNELIGDSIGGDYGKEELEDDFTEETTCLRGTDLPDMKTGLPLRAPVRYIKASKLNKCKLESGDLVIEISGGTEGQSTGRAIYINDEILSHFNRPMTSVNFCRILRPQEKDYSYFTYLFIDHLYRHRVFFNLENGSTGIKNLDLKTLLNDYEIQLPINDLILRFDRIVNKNFVKIQRNNKEIQTLTQLRDTLLPKLMSGELRVNS